MSEYKHILTDFKDLRKVIGKITKTQPAKSRYQQQAEKMKYNIEAEPKDDKDGEDNKNPDHAGEEEIKKAYLALGKSVQGSVEFQRGLVQKQLAKMGYKTYSKQAFSDLFGVESNDLDEWTISDVERAMKKKYGKVDKEAIAKLKKVQHMGNVDRNALVKVGHGKLLVQSVEIDEESKYVKVARDVVKKKSAKKVDGVLLDLFTASAIVKVYDAVNSKNKKKMDGLKLKQLSDIAFRAMKKEEVDLDESDLGLIYKKGKTVQVTHKTSGNELIIIDKPSVRKEYEKIGYFAKEEVDLDEWKMGDGRPRGASHIENIRFWDLPKDQLEYIKKELYKDTSSKYYKYKNIMIIMI